MKPTFEDILTGGMCEGFLYRGAEIISRGSERKKWMMTFCFFKAVVSTAYAGSGL